MRKLIRTLLTLIGINLLIPLNIYAATTNFITPVFPVRSPQYWRQGSGINHFNKLYSLVKQTTIPSTWLIQYDVLNFPEIISKLDVLPNAEVGLFLEVTRKLAEDSFVKYQWQHDSWSSAYKVFLSGYTLIERQRMIDNAFQSFKAKFGKYPASYGAWYIDVYSMEYIRDKYSAKITLGLSDQYSTDGYQTWGQYINVPYYISKTSAIEPAQDEQDSTSILKVQWAPREPTVGFGNNVNSSNFSLQANDYHRFHDLDIKYFQTLLNNLTINVPGSISQAVVGIEVGELEDMYFYEIEKQIQLLSDLEKQSVIKNVTLSEFYRIYSNKYKFVSPPSIVNSSYGNQSTWWYFNNNYRLGINISPTGTKIIDLRYYHFSDYRDNDQIQADTRKNLVRLVPAIIDQTVLNNSLVLSKAPVLVETHPDYLRFYSDEGELIATQSGIINSYSGVDNNLLSPPTFQKPTHKYCFNQYGGYSGLFGCIEKLIVFISEFIPDFVYSNINNQYYFGLRVSWEDFVGLRFPQFKISKFHFNYPILDSFIGLKQKLSPKFTWTGKQELELDQFKTLGKVLNKGQEYGQDELLNNQDSHKLYENSYYAVFSID